MRRSTLTLAIFSFAISAHAEVKLNPLFTDNALLQRNISCPIWGTARDGEAITVSFRNQKVQTTAPNGRWMVRLSPLQAGGPDTLTVKGDNTLTLNNVLVGDVYVCSGQSNMEFGLGSATNGKEAIAASADPMLRLFHVRKNPSLTPLTEVVGTWQQSSPQTTGGFSAVGYFYGKSLRDTQKIPIGLIESDWGGSPAEAWTRTGALESDPALRYMPEKLQSDRADYPLAAYKYRAAKAEATQAKAQGKPAPPAPQAPPDIYHPFQPASLYNGMIAPLIPYAINGAIWYQGESNAGRAYEYMNLFPKMIQNWRVDWGQGDFHFFFVQLAPWQAIVSAPMEGGWPELREAQRLTSLNLKNTGQAVITEFGDERDIHPRNKQPVGERLALQARAQIYHEKVVFDGPLYDSLSIKGSTATVNFRSAKGGLQVHGDKLLGFTIAGTDGKFHNASAEVRGTSVVVSSSEVAKPVAVRFGWANYPVVNLFNKAGLPATPFRTDNFKLVTNYGK